MASCDLRPSHSARETDLVAHLLNSLWLMGRGRNYFFISGASLHDERSVEDRNSKMLNAENNYVDKRKKKSNNP